MAFECFAVLGQEQPAGYHASGRMAEESAAWWAKRQPHRKWRVARLVEKVPRKAKAKGEAGG